MKKILVFIGIVVVALGIMPLLAFLVVPATMRSIDQAPALKAFLQPIMCQSRETLTSTQSITHDLGGTSFNANFSCVNAQGQARDVTSTAWVYGVGGFVVPLLIAIVLISLGTRKPKRKVPSTAAQISQRQGGFSVADRLNALKSDLDAGLITEAQFEAERQLINRQQ